MNPQDTNEDKELVVAEEQVNNQSDVKMNAAQIEIQYEKVADMSYDDKCAALKYYWQTTFF